MENAFVVACIKFANKVVFVYGADEAVRADLDVSAAAGVTIFPWRYTSGAEARAAALRLAGLPEGHSGAFLLAANGIVRKAVPIESPTRLIQPGRTGRAIRGFVGRIFPVYCPNAWFIRT